MSAADMAEARSTHPATARKPMVQGVVNDLSIIPTVGVSFCCCWHGIRKKLVSDRSRPFSEASPGDRDSWSTAFSPCCATDHQAALVLVRDGRIQTEPAGFSMGTAAPENSGTAVKADGGLNRA